MHVSCAFKEGIGITIQAGAPGSRDSVEIRNSAIENVDGYGIYVDPAADMPNSNISIVNTTIENTGSYGIFFPYYGPGSPALGGVLIDNVVIRNVAECGIYDRGLALGLGNNTIRNTIIEKAGAGSGSSISEAGAGIFVGTSKSTESGLETRDTAF